MDISTLQWLMLLLFGVAFFIVSPKAKTAGAFFKAQSGKGSAPTAFLLTSSLVIAWIFAKSIANAANLGMEFGLVGGVAYACYYLSFLTGGVIIYLLRTRGKFLSIHQFLHTRFGRGAVRVFSIVIGFRLFNEVWSNTMVIGSYFGPSGSREFYLAVVVFTLLTLAYSLKGGMRTSLLTDSIQMVFFVVLLIILLFFILPQSPAGLEDYLHSGQWNMNGGIALLFTVFIQIFSYPFHDPVLTDRGFLSPPSTTIKSYLFATVIGFTCMLLFSLIGIFAGFKQLHGQATVEVSKLLGVVVMLTMNLIMITSAASTIDSTFASSAKLLVVDLQRKDFATINRGRVAMAVVAVLGTIPVFLGADILSATTISGTMVIGLAPVFLCWRKKAPPLSFHLSIWGGVVVGILFALNLVPGWLVTFKGPYGTLLSVNFWGSVLCFLLYFLPIWLRSFSWKPARLAHHFTRQQRPV